MSLPKLFPSRGLVIPRPVETDVKRSSFGLLPQGAYGANYTFFSPDGGRTIIDIADQGHAAIAFAAYWYVATRWRAQKIAEAPIMVVEEDQETGDESWIANHPLSEILDQPSPDYDMGDLIETTSHYLDNSGAALWVLDRDRVGRIGRITPFNRYQFEPHRDNTRLYAYFTVQTASGPEDFAAEDVCFFQDTHGSSSIQTGDAMWMRGHAKLDIAMQWLRLGVKATSTIHDLLGNSMWPSAVMVPDKEWNPDPKTFLEYKNDLEAYARQGNKGKPFVALGGGTFTPLSSSIKDLVPTDILNRVESVVAAISGVPAIVLQYQVGLENSPWSQMSQARKMAYTDCIVPSWKRLERVMTRQILRPADEDLTHFLRFDRSTTSLQEKEQLQATQIAVLMGRAASLNERRVQMDLEPLDDPKADEVPELTQPSMMDILASQQSTPPAGNKDPNATDPSKTPPEDTTKKQSMLPRAIKYRALLAKKVKTLALQESFRHDAQQVLKLHVHSLLKHDAQNIADLALAYLTDATQKSISKKTREKARMMDAVKTYLDGPSKVSWSKVAGPPMVRAAERSTAVVGADLNVAYSVLHPNVLAFSQRTTGKMITRVSKTTQSLVSDIVQGGLDAGASKTEIARLISDATGFSDSRAETIATTETTKIFNGAPTESLIEFSAATGKLVFKTWSGALDEKERDEHLAMEGETVPVDEPYSNDLMYPEEPNCRCTSLFSMEDEDS